MLTAKEAAARLGLKSVTVRAHIKNGNLKAHKFGKVWAIDEADLQDFVSNRRGVGRPKDAAVERE